MRKFISIVLIYAVLLLCFSGCSIPDEDQSSDTGSKTESKTEASTEPATTETTEPATTETTEPATTETTEPNTESDTESEMLERLNEIFEMIRTDAGANTKIEFDIVYEEEYFELKSSGEYDNSTWDNHGFVVHLSCDYDLATNEDWYKLCDNTDTVNVNQAFYDHYRAGVSNGTYWNSIYEPPGMALTYDFLNAYDLLNAFCEDYTTIVELANLDYVTRVQIAFYYGLPQDWWLE
ncbi:MAG: hypothetical protein IJC64_03965 [Clostridia bacterium]|nr:hypothetical protein [Clostridia bacterium]